MTETLATPALLRWSQCQQPVVRALLARYQLELVVSAANQPIPGSYWGNEEAGLIGNKVFVRNDTPLHSLLHETCHAICMQPQRRQALHTDAGGDDAEENAVCYLQILLAEQLPGYSSQQCCADMDAWGYSFRLGSAQRWFESDAKDARDWLHEHALLPTQG